MRARRGLSLLEVMVALALLTLAAAGYIALSAQSRWSGAQTRTREAEIRAASEELSRLRVWDVENFEQRIGTSRTRRFVLRIDPAAPRLYRVAVADTATGRVLLATSFYVAGDDATR